MGAKIRRTVFPTHLEGRWEEVVALDVPSSGRHLIDKVVFGALRYTIILQNPSERSILCHSISQVQSVSNMNLRMECMTVPSAFTPDWSLAGSLVVFTEGCERCRFLRLPGSRCGGIGTSADRLRMIHPRRLTWGTTATREIFICSGTPSDPNNSASGTTRPKPARC